MRKFIIYKQEDGITTYFQYTSMMGVRVFTTDKSEAMVFNDGNKMRKQLNRLNKQKNVHHREEIK